MSDAARTILDEPIAIGPHPSQRGLYRLQCRHQLAASQDEVFAFFANAHALEEITPPWLRFHVLTPAPIAMRAGTLIDYRLMLRGLPIGWRSEISLWEPPHRFVDEMRRGPYRSWRHLHTFTPVDGGTLVEDVVEYGVPGGALIHHLLVAPDLRRIFEHRRKALAEHFPEHLACSPIADPGVMRVSATRRSEERVDDDEAMKASQS